MALWVALDGQVWQHLRLSLGLTLRMALMTLRSSLTPLGACLTRPLVLSLRVTRDVVAVCVTMVLDGLLLWAA